MQAVVYMLGEFAALFRRPSVGGGKCARAHLVEDQCVCSHVLHSNAHTGFLWSRSVVPEDAVLVLGF